MNRLLLAGFVSRQVLPYLSLPTLLSRPELSTPITNYNRLLEGYWLLDRSVNPYEGGSFHHSPLLLLLSPLDLARRPWLATLIWSLAEIATAAAIARIAQNRRRGKSLEGESWSSPLFVAALFLFHPFSILTALSRSTIVFSNCFVALAVASAIDGSTIMTAFSLSLATHLSLYPILLLPAIVLLLIQHQPTLAAPAIDAEPATSDPPATTQVFRETNGMRRIALETVAAFALHQISLLGMSRWITGNWNFLYSVYGVILTIPDLTPTIGLGWYFFIEMFDHFRTFFVGVFQLHLLMYVAPLCLAFRKDPLFAVMIQFGVICIFKSYSALGDFALWHTLLMMNSELHSYLATPLLLISLTLYSLCLFPTFHHLWLYSGSGNANFFYASTLVWAISQGGILLDFLSAKGRREILEGLGEKGRERVRLGEWKVVQK